jgi:hypothetical protein
LEWKLEEEGFDLLVLAREDEIVPDEERYYMIDPLNSTKFYRTSFDPIMEWDSILEFVNAKRIYVRKRVGDQSTEQPQEMRPIGDSNADLPAGSDSSKGTRPSYGRRSRKKTDPTAGGLQGNLLFE